MEYAYLKFLNLQYFFCIIYSLFGGKCTSVEPLEGAVATSTLPGVSTEINAASSTVTTTVDFWTWLFSGGNGAADSAVTSAGQGGVLESASQGALLFDSVFGGFFGAVWGVFGAISYTLSGLGILLLIGAAVGIFFIRQDEARKYSTLPPTYETASNARTRWRELLDRAISTDPKEWRMGILEADVMLGELLEKLGYQGGSTQERLRAVPEGAFVTLPNAWEAHRIRNFVSSRSSDYILTQREAFRVMKLYEQVFEEFDFI